MTKVNLKNGNETKPGIFLWGIFISDIIRYFSKNIKVFNQNRISSVLWLNCAHCAQKLGVKQNQTISDETYSNSTSFFTGLKTLKYPNQAFSRDFQHACDKMHAYKMLGMRLSAICIFLFLNFYNFTKRIVPITRKQWKWNKIRPFSNIQIRHHFLLVSECYISIRPLHEIFNKRGTKCKRKER